MPLRQLAVLLLPLLLLAACTGERNPTPGQAASPPAAETTAPLQSIAWFDGTLEEAFAAARTQDKPLFVYWGAEWCPYCKQLQATIFVREEFIQMSRQFIAIDMSNGTSEKVRQGERFNIMGLPTVIVFAPDGSELTRIPGGMDLEQYAAALALTLERLRPVSALLAAAQAGNRLEDDDWRLLGSHDWWPAPDDILGEQKAEVVLAQLAADCPPQLSLACSGLRLSATRAWLNAGEEERDAAMRAAHLGGFSAILEDPALRRAHIVSLSGLGADVVKVMAAGEEQAPLQASLLQHLGAAVDDASLNILRRAAVLSGWSEVAAALLEEGATLPPEQAQWLRDSAEQMLAELSPYEIHAGVNSLSWAYYQAGLQEETRTTLARGIAESKTPYYFMATMGHIELDAENEAAALDWFRKAWDATSQPFDRARWGGSYLRKLLELTPDQVAEIEQTATQWLEEVLAQPDALEIFARSLERMSEKLLAWSEGEPGRAEVIAALRADMAAHCGAGETDATSAASCAGFLQAAELASAGAGTAPPG